MSDTISFLSNINFHREGIRTLSFIKYDLLLEEQNNSLEKKIWLLKLYKIHNNNRGIFHGIHKNFVQILLILPKFEQNFCESSVLKQIIFSDLYK